MTTLDRESVQREKVRDAAPDLLRALLEMVETHDGPVAGPRQHGARIFARSVLAAVRGEK